MQMMARMGTKQKMRKRVDCFLVTLVAWAAAAAFTAAQEKEQTAGDYAIGAGDVLQIVVWKNPELSMDVPVRPDGFISLPLLDDVRAAGLTPIELRDVLRQRLAEFVASPVVSVIVMEVHSFTVSILGKVRQPGRYELRAPTTVLDLLALAGGFDEFSSPGDTYVLRSAGQAYQRIPFDYSRAITAAGKSANVEVEPGDIIIVP